jgi:hypothetical protein
MKTDDLIFGIIIPLAGLFIGVLQWTNKETLRKLWQYWWIIFIPLSIYYSLSWIPKTLKHAVQL